MLINKHSSTPIKIQAKKELQRMILSRELQPGDQLPSERTLQTELEISRTTLRVVLDELQREGLIFSHPGKGRYVAATILEQQLNRLTGFSQDMRNRGIEPAARVIHNQVEASQSEVARQLQIPPGSNILRLKRIRFADLKPVAIEETHINITLCPEIVGVDFEKQSLYDFFIAQGLRPASACQVMTAEIATKEEARTLKIPYPSGIMRMERTTFLSDGTAIEFVRSAYSGMDFQFILSLKPGSEFSGEVRGST
jgi:GntR family transcriptional regulator